MNIKILTFGILLLLITSCASIIHGPKQTVDFSSHPNGANIIIDGVEHGTTPQSIVLRRKGREKGENSAKKTYEVQISMEGYHSYELTIKRQVDGLFMGNLLFGGLIGIIIDASTGSMYKLTPEEAIAQMNANPTSMIESDGEGIYIAVTLKADPSWELVGQLDKIVEY